jgi:hypothetical protein
MRASRATRHTNHAYIIVGGLLTVTEGHTEPTSAIRVIHGAKTAKAPRLALITGISFSSGRKVCVISGWGAK